MSITANGELADFSGLPFMVDPDRRMEPPQGGVVELTLAQPYINSLKSIQTAASQEQAKLLERIQTATTRRHVAFDGAMEYRTTIKGLMSLCESNRPFEAELEAMRVIRDADFDDQAEAMTMVLSKDPHDFYAVQKARSRGTLRQYNAWLLAGVVAGQETDDTYVPARLSVIGAEGSPGLLPVEFGVALYVASVISENRPTYL